jgi:hypothetical protein
VRDEDGGSGALGQFKVAADEIGVQVGLDHVADGEAPRFGLIDVDVDVASRVHDGRLSIGAQQVRGLGQTAQIELLEGERRFGQPGLRTGSGRVREGAGHGALLI